MHDYKKKIKREPSDYHHHVILNKTNYTEKKKEKNLRKN